MSLVTVSDLSLYFVDRPLFEGIALQIEPVERIGLIGANGTGKTTLLRLIYGEVRPDAGKISISKGTRIGYLPQDVQETVSGPLRASVLNAVPRRQALEEELRSTERRLEEASGSDQLRLAERLAELHQEINHLDLQFPAHEAERILLGLGFDTRDFETPVSTLSGGWKMRAALATLLYQKCDLLLLDEPTNHLDIPSIQWLEQFLKTYEGAMLLVSHDREFLNRQTRRTLSIEPEGLRSYTGNYDAYLEARREEERKLEARARKQEQRRKQAQAFIDRFRAKASTARQVQSRIKWMEKQAPVETLRTEKTVRFSFPEAPRSGREVVRIQGISKTFDHRTLYEDLTFTVLRGERIAVIGPNGCGKTTLLRIIAGELSPDRGTITLGHRVELRYFAQHHSDMLDPRKTVFETVQEAAPETTVGFVRNLCGMFLFSGDDVDKAVGVLSGGERARVSLACLIADPGNLMIMDEPSNHLDIASSEALIEALAGYGGTLLFVSHNQSFINRLATRIWDVSNGSLVEFPGNLAEYENHLGSRDKAPPGDGDRPDVGYSSGDSQEAEGDGASSRKEKRRERARHRAMIRETLRPILRDLEALEGRIEELESRQEALEETLQDAELFQDESRSVPVLNEYNDVKGRLESLIRKWEKRQGELEAAKERLGIG